MRDNIVMDKSFEFSVKIVNAYKHLVQECKEFVMSKQLLRCGTSIGANITEAQRGQSKADFRAKMNIALKEAYETDYWFRLLVRTEFLTPEQFVSVDTDLQEIISLLIAICKTSEEKK